MKRWNPTFTLRWRRLSDDGLDEDRTGIFNGGQACVLEQLWVCDLDGDAEWREIEIGEAE